MGNIEMLKRKWKEGGRKQEEIFQASKNTLRSPRRGKRVKEGKVEELFKNWKVKMGLMMEELKEGIKVQGEKQEMR